MSERLGGITRIEATRRVLRSLARRSSHDLTLVSITDGTNPLVVALPNEHVSEVLSRVQALGGVATIAVAYAKNYRLITMGQRNVAHGVVEINEDLSMGMLLIRMENNPGRTLHFRFRDVDTSVPEGSPELAYV